MSLCGLAMMLIALPPALSAQAAPVGISLDSLLNTRISAASKYAQTADEAAASVTIITSDDLERSGYANLSEALEAVRGFYMSSDRNYAYFGTRGFSRPSDYNNRILVLFDGHTINEHAWGSAPMGDDITMDLAAIERIEIIRGPGSVLYGTNALFAVINIVTKSTAALDGVTVGAQLSSIGQRQAMVTAGRRIGRGTDLAFSGSLTRAGGERAYFPEYDAPETNDGMTTHLDSDLAGSMLASLRRGALTARAGFLSRRKVVPTGSFGNTFNDQRTDRLDQTTWAELSGERAFGPRFRMTTRVYADYYRYLGHSAYDTDSVFVDEGWSTATGAEALGIWESSSRNRLTAGVEYRQVLRAEYMERFPDGTTVSDDAPRSIRSVFAQDEYQLSRRLRAVLGYRVESNSLHGTNGAPRLALIVTPDAMTTVKLLYGEAFRAPSAAEADLNTAFYERNPGLRSERIRTTELAVTRRVSDGLLLGGSLYGYRIRDLIDQVEFDVDGRLQYRNTTHSEGAGAEVEADLRPFDALQVRATYAYQFVADGADGARLSNAPEHVALAAATFRTRVLRSTISARYESGRRTFDGSSTRAFVRTDAHVGSSARVLAGATVGVRVSNLFNVRYATPVGIEHLAPAMVQPGRRVSLQLSWEF